MAESVVRPASSDTWPDIEALFGPHGAWEGCWCMFWLLSGPQFRELAADDRRARFRELIRSEAVPGLLAYQDDTPVGWCAVAPRSWFARLQLSPMLAPQERDAPHAWSVNCFFTSSGYRRSGVTRHLLDAAVRHAFAHGARSLEGYPVDPSGRGRMQAAEMYTGTLGLFAEHGFHEIARRTPRRVLMRRWF